MAQSWPWDSQIAVKKKKKSFGHYVILETWLYETENGKNTLTNLECLMRGFFML